MLSRFLELTNYIAALKSRPLDYSVRSRFGDGRSRGSFVSYRSVRFPNSFRRGGKRFILLFWLAFLQRVILFFGFCDKSFRVSVVRRNYRSSLTRARRADRSCSLDGDNPLRALTIWRLLLGDGGIFCEENATG